MIVTNLTSQDQFLGFVRGNASGLIQDVSAHGVNLPANGEVEIDDSFRSHPSLELMIAEGIVNVSSLSVSDSDSPYVSANEFHEFVRGIFQIDDSWVKTGTIGASPTAADLEMATEGPFSMTSDNSITLKFDGLDSQEVRIEFSKGQLSKAALVAELNADANFAIYADANDLGASNGWNIVSKCLGVNSNVEYVDVEGSVHALLGLDEGTLTAGTGDVATVEFDTLNASAKGASGYSHDIKLYTTDFPGVVVDGNHQIQRIQEGTLVSGLHSAEATVLSGKEGKIILEVAQTAAGTAPHFGVDIPANLFLASHPAARLNLA